MKKRTEEIRSIRAKIKKPENWTQEVSFRDTNGHVCDPSKANSFCLLGAAQIVGAHGSTIAWMERQSGKLYLSTYNDTHSHAEVIAFLDNCIDLSERDA